MLQRPVPSLRRSSALPSVAPSGRHQQQKAGKSIQRRSSQQETSSTSNTVDRDKHRKTETHIETKRHSLTITGADSGTSSPTSRTLPPAALLFPSLSVPPHGISTSPSDSLHLSLSVPSLSPLSSSSTPSSLAARLLNVPWNRLGNKQRIEMLNNEHWEHQVAPLQHENVIAQLYGGDNTKRVIKEKMEKAEAAAAALHKKRSPRHQGRRTLPASTSLGGAETHRSPTNQFAVVLKYISNHEWGSHSLPCPIPAAVVSHCEVHQPSLEERFDAAQIAKSVTDKFISRRASLTHPGQPITATTTTATSNSTPTTIDDDSIGHRPSLTNMHNFLSCLGADAHDATDRSVQKHSLINQGKFNNYALEHMHLSKPADTHSAENSPTGKQRARQRKSPRAAQSVQHQHVPRLLQYKSSTETRSSLMEPAVTGRGNSGMKGAKGLKYRASDSRVSGTDSYEPFVWVADAIEDKHQEIISFSMQQQRQTQSQQVAAYTHNRAKKLLYIK